MCLRRKMDERRKTFEDEEEIEILILLRFTASKFPIFGSFSTSHFSSSCIRSGFLRSPLLVPPDSILVHIRGVLDRTS